MKLLTFSTTLVIVLATFVVVINPAGPELPAVQALECNKGEMLKDDSCVLIAEVADSMAECLGLVGKNTGVGISEEVCSDIFKSPSDSIDINSNIATNGIK